MRRAAGVLAVLMIAVALSGCSVRGTLAGANNGSQAATPTPLSTTATPTPGSTTAGSGAAGTGAAGAGGSDPLTGVAGDLGSLDGITNQIDKDLSDGNAAAGKSDTG